MDAMQNQLKFDLTDMQFFVAVIREGSFSKAAKQLYIAQPFLSRKIHALEERLGVTLIERTTRHLQPTPEGKLFYQRAAQILIECDTLERDLLPAVSFPTPEIRLGYGSNGQFAFAMRLVTAMKQMRHEIAVHTEACDTLERLYTGTLDVALMMRCEVNGQDWLEAIPLEAAGLSCFLSVSDPLADEKSELSISDIKLRKFLLPQPRNVSELVPCTTLYEAIHQDLLSCGIPEQNITMAHGMQAFSLSIIAEGAVGIMPDSSEIIANESLICRPAAEYRSGFEVVLAWPRFNTSPKMAQFYRDAAQQITTISSL